MQSTNTDQPAEFRPSNISPGVNFWGSTLNDSIQEDVTAYIVALCTANGDAWNEFDWRTFAGFITVPGNAPNDLTQRHMFTHGSPEVAINAIHALVEMGYLSRDDRDGNTYLTVTPEYVAFMQDYMKRMQTAVD